MSRGQETMILVCVDSGGWGVPCDPHAWMCYPCLRGAEGMSYEEVTPNFRMPQLECCGTCKSQRYNHRGDQWLRCLRRINAGAVFADTEVPRWAVCDVYEAKEQPE